MLTRFDIFLNNITLNFSSWFETGQSFERRRSSSHNLCGITGKTLCYMKSHVPYFLHRHQHEKSLMKTFSNASLGSSLGLHRSTSHLNHEDKGSKLNNHANHDDHKEKAKLEMVKVDVDNNMVSACNLYFAFLYFLSWC